MRGSPKMQNFSSTYLVEWEVLSKLQVACLCCFIFQPQIGFLLSIFATFLVLSYSNVPLRLPNVSLLRPATASWAQREFCSLHSLALLLLLLLQSLHGFLKLKWGRNLQHFSTEDINFTPKKSWAEFVWNLTKMQFYWQKCLMLDICSMNNHYLEINTSNKQEEVF